MKLRMFKLFAWLLLTLALLSALDQLLVRVPLDLPVIKQAQTFYVDFRGRLLGLIGVDRLAAKPGKSIEQVIEANRQQPVNKPAKPQRYLYVDEGGALQFADSLQQVPARFREQAQPLAE